MGEKYLCVILMYSSVCACRWYADHFLADSILAVEERLFQVRSFDESLKGAFVNIFKNCKSFLSLYHLAIHHAIQQMGIMRHKIGMNIVCIAINNELEGSEGIDTSYLSVMFRRRCRCSIFDWS